MNVTNSLALHRPFSLATGNALTQTFWITTFALLTAVGAQIEIPHQPVPYTFQTLVVLLAGAVLGPRNGFLSMMMYLSLGAIGMPVFSGGGFCFRQCVSGKSWRKLLSSSHVSSGLGVGSLGCHFQSSMTPFFNCVNRSGGAGGTLGGLKSRLYSPNTVVAFS